MDTNRMFFISALSTIVLAAAALVKTFMLTTSMAGTESSNVKCCSMNCAVGIDSIPAVAKNSVGLPANHRCFGKPRKLSGCRPY